MMKRITLAMIGLATLSTNAQEANNVVGSTGAFSSSLYEQLAKEAKVNDNLFFSPYSISLALGMTYAGARNETETEMAAVLHFSSNDSKFHKHLGNSQKKILSSGSKGVQIAIANQIWADRSYKFRCSYLRGVKKAYDAPVERLNFRLEAEPSRLKINNWVEKHTNDLIKDLLPEGSITDLTTMVLTNAIYFKGQWAEKFKVEDTRSDVFFPTTHEKVECSMMNRAGTYNLAHGDGFRMLEMPYAGNDFSMLVILPDEGNDLSKVEKTFSHQSLQELTRRLAETEVKLSFPRFRFETEYELKPTLSAMGMPLAFSNRADFTRMSTKPDLKIDEVYHKAFVEVSEEGTEAAAATAVVIVRKAMPMYQEFIANKPFIFLIRQNSSGIILFMGRVTKPTF
jgi:serpin B